MRGNRRSARAWWLAAWRDQSGEAVLGIIVLAASLAAVLAGFLNVAGSPADRLHIGQCLQNMDAATQSLKQKYGEQGKAPFDDIDVNRIRVCKDFAATLAADPTFGNNAAIKNLAATATNLLSGLGSCSITEISPSEPRAGITVFLNVSANMPFTGSDAGDAGSTATVGGNTIPLSMAPGSAGSTSWSGGVSISDAASSAAGGTVSVVTVKGRSDVGRLANGSCPGGTDGSVPGKCFVTCTTPAKNVVWKDPPIPQIKLFLAAPSTVAKGAPTPVGLTWIVKDAESVTIDQGVGEVGLVGVDLQFPPDQDTTYTLTAKGVRLQDTRTATAKVTVEQAPVVTLTAPANNSAVTGAFPTVPVAGTVQNATPGMTVAISVNGAQQAVLPVSGGSFAGSVSLNKTLSVSDLSLNNPSVQVNSQGAVQVPVTLSSGKSSADVTNVITATISGPSLSVDSSVVVYHTVQVNEFVVTWLSCPPLNKDQALSTPLGAGQSVPVGTVDCGVTSGSFCSTCSVRASVSTSVGSLASTSTWVFKVGNCP